MTKEKRQQALDSARASVTLEGPYTPSPLAEELEALFVAGDITIDQAIQRLREHYTESQA